MASTNKTSSANTLQYHWQIQNTKSRGGTDIPELLEKYPYSQTRKAVTANETQPVPVG